MKANLFYSTILDKSLKGEMLTKEECTSILRSNDLETLSLLNTAFEVRKKYTGKEVSIHIINNAQNGLCPEDCKYCAQAKTSDSPIEEYPLKSEEEILKEAENAYKRGAHRYCMVFAGRGPSKSRTEKLAGIVRKIKEQYPIEVCVSPGLLDEEKAQTLKDAGLDRLNHNLNTSEENYKNICSTHTFKDRLNTLEAGKKAGLQLCSGVIIGMKESDDEIIEIALKLRELNIASIPVNFLIPVMGNKLKEPQNLTPEFCLRILCLFRLLNPKSEIRMAAGRELHLRSLQVMGLYAANSLFLDGYLNVKGSERTKTLQMIKDAGFTIKSEYPLDDLINEDSDPTKTTNNKSSVSLKKIDDLRPAISS